MQSPEDSLKASPEASLLSWIQQNAPYGVVTLDPSFHVRSWNHWMETHSALKTENVLGQSLFTLFQELDKRSFERALGGESCVLSTTLHHHLLPLPSPMREPVGALMRQTARVAPLLSEGQVTGIVLVIEDVTQREIQSEALITEHRRQEMLSWTLGHLLRSGDPRKMMRQIFFKIAENLDFDTFIMYLRDMDTGVLSLYTAGGLSPEAEPDFADCPVLVNVAQARELVVFDSVQDRMEPEFAVLKRTRISAAIAIPLLVNDRALGLLCFGTWNRNHIGQEESELLIILSQYLAITVDREATKQQLQKAQSQLAQHAQLLEQKVDERTSRLQETISELEMLSYTLAHDLKAPVRNMLSYCQILLNDFGDALPPSAALILQRLARTPKRLEILIQRLLEFSKVSRQQVVLDRVEIEPVVDELLALRAPEVLQAVTMVKPLAVVRAHRDLLQQVLSNLVDNAAKFTKPQTAPKITISSELVTSASTSIRGDLLLFSAIEPHPPTPSASPADESPNARVRIWVSDEGIGISQELHHKIFGIFERGVNAEAYEGTGMGLAVVARAMQRMGGGYGLESQPEKGSRFWIELPAA